MNQTSGSCCCSCTQRWMADGTGLGLSDDPRLLAPPGAQSSVEVCGGAVGNYW